ncbi:response regulator transcription factor [Cytobacillus suaedae]|nr:response regulator transcription factor [Cytobacillus suaedae]
MDNKIRVIIAEAHVEAQRIIVSLLQPLEAFEVISITDNGESLIDLNANYKPQLIIADIDMPKLNGIEAIKSCLKVNPELKFLFTTAYNKFAVVAFDLNAVDYIVKPIKRDRLYVALEKAKKIIIPHQQEEEKKNLSIQMDRTTYFIPFSEVFFIERYNRKSIIHTLEQSYNTNESLNSIFKKLSQSFFRTHRSFIVNLNHISHITVEGETYYAHFRNHTHYAHISKLRINELHNKLS